MEKLLKRPEEFVDCWNDDERMDFLFSSFPANFSANPEHWTSKMEFWTDLISKLCEKSTAICIDFNVVSTWLERNGRRPMGLQVVWDTMVGDGSLVSAQEYVGDLARNSSWVGWGLNMVVRKPTLWMAGKMLSPLKTLSPVKATEQKKSFICVKSYKQKCLKLLQTLHQRASNNQSHLHILSLHEITGLAQHIAIDPKELEMVLLALEQDKKVVVFNKSESKSPEKFVKFAIDINQCVTPVNEGDLGFVKLEHTKQALIKQISNLYEQQDYLLATAKGFIHSGERTRAKMALRQKQRISMNIKRKETSLDNIEQLLFRLEQCGTDQMIMDAYKAGVSAFKNATKGMSVDDADSTMDDVQAALDDHEEITSALSTALNDNVIIDDLEQELNDLLAEEETEPVNNLNDSDVIKSGAYIKSPGGVTRSMHRLPSRGSKSSASADEGPLRERGDDIVTNQTDADIAKLVTGIAAANMREQPIHTKSPKRTASTLH